MTPPVLVATVAAVGVLHTLVPDHWAPIVVVGRQQGWSVARTARAAMIAGVGHVVSTLALGLLMAAAGAVLAVRYGHFVSVAAAVALMLFGGWIAYGGIRELRAAGHGHEHGHSHDTHAHLHRHGDGTEHVHLHEHHDHDAHTVTAGAPAEHTHDHQVGGRTALMLIVGSSPMIEGIPAFLAAAPYGVAFLALLSAVFAAATIVTYVAVSAAGIAGLQRASFGPLERYGEVISGALVMLVGLYALVTA